MAAQLKNFLDQTGPLWIKGALVNKVATVMSSTATQHGGAELAILIDPGDLAASGHDHRAAVLCLSGPVRQRRGARRLALRHDHHVRVGRLAPALAQELEGAKFQGKRLAEIAIKLSAESRSPVSGRQSRIAATVRSCWAAWSRKARTLGGGCAPPRLTSCTGCLGGSKSVNTAARLPEASSSATW